MSRPSLALVLAVAALVLAPVAARGATVSWTLSPTVSDREGDSSSFSVAGEPGPDDLRITWSFATSLDVVDPTRPVSLAAGAERHCAVVDAHHVHCDGATGHDSVGVSGGDGDDAIQVAGDRDLRVGGGAGNDVLQGGDENDQLFGDAGDDLLVGAGGRDELTGGPGRDTLQAGAGDDTLQLAAADAAAGETLDGGPGVDRVMVQAPGVPATVDLGARAAMVPSGTVGLDGMEGANVTASPALARGGAGPDVLAVSPGGTAEGGGGDDDLFTLGDGATLRGGDGRDTIGVGAADVVDGGPGDDHLTLATEEGALPRVACGAGVDVLDEAGGFVRPMDCESSRVWFGRLGAVRLHVHSATVAGAIELAGIQPAACSTRVTGLTSGGRAVTTPVTVRRAGGGFSARLPLRAGHRWPRVLRIRLQPIRCGRSGRVIPRPEDPDPRVAVAPYRSRRANAHAAAASTPTR